MTIVGANLAGVRRIFFNNAAESAQASSFAVQSDTVITVTIPPHQPGLVDVRLETASAFSPITVAGQFTYPPPVRGAFEQMRDEIRALAISGVVNKGQQTSLTSKLNTIEKILDIRFPASTINPGIFRLHFPRSSSEEWRR